MFLVHYDANIYLYLAEPLSLYLVGVCLFIKRHRQTDPGVEFTLNAMELGVYATFLSCCKVIYTSSSVLALSIPALYKT